jgi:hypothetical protein
VKVRSDKEAVGAVVKFKAQLIFVSKSRCNEYSMPRRVSWWCAFEQKSDSALTCSGLQFFPQILSVDALLRRRCLRPQWLSLWLVLHRHLYHYIDCLPLLSCMYACILYEHISFAFAVRGEVIQFQLSRVARKLPRSSIIKIRGYCGTQPCSS